MNLVLRCRTGVFFYDRYTSRQNWKGFLKQEHSTFTWSMQAMYFGCPLYFVLKMKIHEFIGVSVWHQFSVFVCLFEASGYTCLEILTFTFGRNISWFPRINSCWSSVTVNSVLIFVPPAILIVEWNLIWVPLIDVQLRTLGGSSRQCLLPTEKIRNTSVGGGVLQILNSPVGMVC